MITNPSCTTDQLLSPEAVDSSPSEPETQGTLFKYSYRKPLFISFFFTIKAIKTVPATKPAGFSFLM